MKISDIKMQVKNKDRFSVFVDGKYSFSLSAWQIGELKLKVGQEIDESIAAEMAEQSDFGKLYDRTLRWAYLRRRSEREIDDYLRKITKDEDVQGQIKERLANLGLIDDAEFARVWVSSRRRSKLASSRKLRLELIKKGVEDSVINDTLEEDENTDEETLRQLIIKKRKIKRYQDDEKLMQYLSRQGYSYGQIKDVLEN